MMLSEKAMSDKYIYEFGELDTLSYEVGYLWHKFVVADENAFEVIQKELVENTDSNLLWAKKDLQKELSDTGVDEDCDYIESMELEIVYLEDLKKELEACTSLEELKNTGYHFITKHKLLQG